MSYIKIAVGCLISILLFIGGSIAIERAIVANVDLIDMLPVHEGCTAFYEGISPYDAGVTTRIQARITEYWSEYDPSAPSADQHRFAYPAHTCLILSPIFLPDYDLSVAPWIMFNLLLFMLLPIFFQRQIVKTELPVWQVAITIMVTLFFWRYSVATLVLGQFVGWILLCMTGVVWALLTQRDKWLAVFLVGLTIRTGGGVLAIGVLLWTLYKRRYTVFALFTAIMLALWAGTILIINDIWIFDFLSRLTEYTTYRDVAGWVPFRLGVPLGSIFAFLVAVSGSYILWGAWQKNRHTGLLWSFAVIPLFILLYLPQTNTYTLVYALTSVWVIGYVFRAKPISYALSMLMIALMPWVWYLLLQDILGINNDQALIPIIMMSFVFVAWQFGDVALEEHQAENDAEASAS